MSLCQHLGTILMSILEFDIVVTHYTFSITHSETKIPITHFFWIMKQIHWTLSTNTDMYETNITFKKMKVIEYNHMPHVLVSVSDTSDTSRTFDYELNQ